MSFTRRTHWRNNARTSAARKLRIQHKCRPQGGGQSTTSLVADLISVEVKARQRHIRLVKIPRTCHGAAWSTHLTDVDNHPCISCRVLLVENFVATGKKKRQKLYSCVTLWQKLSGCVVHRGLWNQNTTSTRHQRPADACLADLRRDSELLWRNMFFDNRTRFKLSSHGVPHLMKLVGSWGLASDAASHLVRSTSTLATKAIDLIQPGTTETWLSKDAQPPTIL